MTGPDFAVGLFTVCNVVRVVAYLPQLVCIGRDPHGATAISYTSWWLFTASNFSTVLYALMVTDDRRMAALFAVNTLCCAAIVGFTAYKRAQYRRQRFAFDAERIECVAGRGAWPSRRRPELRAGPMPG